MIGAKVKMVNILAVISDTLYASKICEIVKDSEEISLKTLYVSLNKTYHSLVEEFSDAKIDLNKFVFIDTITATIIEPKPVDNCVFLPKANDVKRLYSEIIRLVKHGGIDMLIFDSISSFTVYNNTEEILHFLTTLIGALSVLGCSSLFTCLSEDENSHIIKQIRMRIDKSYDLTE